MGTIATILPPPRTVFLDLNSNPLSGGKVYTYEPSTTTPQTTWQDAGETTPNSNPIILDGNGSCLLYGNTEYTLTVTDSLGNLVYTGLTQDLYSLILQSNNAFTGTDDFTNGTILVPTVSPGDNSNNAASTAFVDNAISSSIALPTSPAFVSLIAQWASNTTFTVTCNNASLANSLGQVITVAATSPITNTITSTGANGIDTATVSSNTNYICYLIYNSTSQTVASLISLSATPTLPSGYTYYGAYGTISLDVSTHIRGFFQRGDTMQFRVGSNLSSLPSMLVGPMGTAVTPSYITMAAMTYANPAIPIAEIGIFGYATATSITMAAPNSTYGNYGPGNSSQSAPPLVLNTGASQFLGVSTWLTLESTNIFGIANTLGCYINCLGYRYNI